MTYRPRRLLWNLIENRKETRKFGPCPICFYITSSCVYPATLRKVLDYLLIHYADLFLIFIWIWCISAIRVQSTEKKWHCIHNNKPAKYQFLACMDASRISKFSNYSTDEKKRVYYKTFSSVCFLNLSFLASISSFRSVSVQRIYNTHFFLIRTSNFLLRLGCS